MKKLLPAIFLLPLLMLTLCSREAAKEVITDQFLRYHENIEAATLVDSGNYGRLSLDNKGIPISAKTWISNTSWEKYYFDGKGRITKQEFLPAIKTDSACESIEYRYNEKDQPAEALYRCSKSEMKTKRYFYDHYGLTEIRWLNSRGLVTGRTKVEYNFNDLTVAFVSQDGKNEKRRVLFFEKKTSRTGHVLYDTTMTLRLLPDEFQNRSIKEVKSFSNGRLTGVKKPKRFSSR